jgi:polysaccharide biosynthesis transport protein
MAQSGGGEQSHLRGFLRVLNRRRLLITLVALLGAGLALAYSFASRPTYSARALVLVPSTAAGSPQRTLADQLQLARGDAIQRAAESALGYQANASVSSSSSADVLTFTAHSTDRAGAAAVANAYADAFITQQRARQSAGRQGPEIVEAAVTPASSATSRTAIRNGVLGLLGGLVFGIALAFLVDHLDERITSRQVAERACGGRPVVGLIPKMRGRRRKRAPLALAENPASGVAEAYRTLGTSLQFLGTGRPNRVVAITSAVAGDGKTTAVANLAVSFARAGRRVIVLSADLRQPRIHEFFGLGNDAGLTSLLRGEAGLADILFTVPGEPRLRVIPSGPIPPNPAEILSLDGMRQLCGLLRDNSDMVLIDCPPVLPVTDALLLSQMVDGVLLVVSVSTTTRTELDRACGMLDLVHGPVTGTVLNRVPTRGPGASAFGPSLAAGRQTRRPPASTAPAPPVQVPAPSGSGRATVDLRSSRRNSRQPGRPKTSRSDPRRLLDYSHEFGPTRVRSK